MSMLMQAPVAYAAAPTAFAGSVSMPTPVVHDANYQAKASPYFTNSFGAAPTYMSSPYTTNYAQASAPFLPSAPSMVAYPQASPFQFYPSGAAPAAPAAHVPMTTAPAAAKTPTAAAAKTPTA